MVEIYINNILTTKNIKNSSYKQSIIPNIIKIIISIKIQQKTKITYKVIYNNFQIGGLWFKKVYKMYQITLKIFFIRWLIYCNTLCEKDTGTVSK